MNLYALYGLKNKLSAFAPLWQKTKKQIIKDTETSSA